MNKLTFILISGFMLFWVLTPIKSSAQQIPARNLLAVEAHHSRLLTVKQPIIRASVANPKIADVNVLTPTQVLVVAKAKTAGSTTLILWLSEDHAVTYDVQVYTQIPQWVINSMKQRIKELAPDVDVTLSPGSSFPEEHRLILSGTVPSIDTMNRVQTIAKSFEIKFYNLIRVAGPQQVQLKVVIAEVSKSGLKQMGLSFIRLSDRMSLALSKGGGFSFESNESGQIEFGTDISSPFASAFNLAMVSFKNDIGGILSLLKEQGLSRTLASPTLVTMNGQKAEFQVGGSYPVPVATDSGIGTEDREYGIILEFTPYILGNDTITLEVMPEVSAPDFSVGLVTEGATVPGQTTRKASTTLQLKNGQTFAMAGLIKEEFYQTVDKVPFLGDIPYIGSAFTQKETSRSESELVIMVTPSIVRPMAQDEVPELPGSGIDPNISDTDFFLKNQMAEEKKPEQARTQTPGFIGKTGFAK